MEALQLAAAITGTVNRYWDGMMSHPTYKSHVRSLWGTVQAKGLAEPVTEALEPGVLNALQRVALVPRKAVR